MYLIPEDYTGVVIGFSVLIGIIIIQRSKWGIVMRTREGMKLYLSDLIYDKLLDMVVEGKITTRQAYERQVELSKLLDLTYLHPRNPERLKATIIQRIRKLQDPFFKQFNNGFSKLLGDKPPQDVQRKTKKSLSSYFSNSTEG